MNKRLSILFKKMKEDPHSVSLNEIFIIVDGLIEDLENTLRDVERS